MRSIIKVLTIVGIEADYSFAKGFDVYLQVNIDDISSPNELAEESTYPVAIGFLGGVKGAFNIGKGVLKASLEGAYTSPYLYLRGHTFGSQNEGEYGVNFVGMQKTTESFEPYLRKFIGYTFGGDAIVADARASYTEYGKFSVQAETFFMIHGEKNIDSLYNDRDNVKTPSGTVTTTFMEQVYADWNITKHIKAFGQYNFISCLNKIDNQIVLGVNLNY